MTTTLSARTYESGQWTEREVEVRFTKRSYGGYNIVRADNGRSLGWIVKGGARGWEGYTSGAAFRGTGADDEGDVLDYVPLHLFNGINSLASRPSFYGRTREEAAEELLYRLVRDHAPAVGFGAHYEVRPHKAGA